MDKAPLQSGREKLHGNVKPTHDFIAHFILYRYVKKNALQLVIVCCFMDVSHFLCWISHFLSNPDIAINGLINK